MTTRSSSFRCVSAAEHHTTEQDSKTGQTKIRKHLARSNLSLNTRQDLLKIPSFWDAAMETERRCFSNVHLGIKCLSQYNKVVRLLQHSSANSSCGRLGMHCAWLGDHESLSLTRIQFHLSKVTPLTNLAKVSVKVTVTVSGAKVTVQGLLLYL